MTRAGEVAAGHVCKCKCFVHMMLLVLQRQCSISNLAKNMVMNKYAF